MQTVNNFEKTNLVTFEPGPGPSETTSGSEVVLTSGIGTTANTTTNCIDTSPFFTRTTGFSYTTPVVYSPVVKRANNGYVVENGYELYIAKNEKELTKILVDILNPKKEGKKRG